MLERPLRAAIFAAANSPFVQRGVQRYGMRLGARRFVAGETASEFMPVARDAHRLGFAVAATLLGESVRDVAHTRVVTAEYCRLLEAFARENLDANVAFKLTHVGLDIDPDLAFENAAVIAATAAETGNTIRIDMEQSRYVDRTLATYRALHYRHDNVGFVLQSYLYRSEADLRSMLSLSPNVRIVKGAYLEPRSIAFAQKRDVDANYLKLVQIALTNDGYTAIATHDPSIIARVASFATSRGLPKSGRFEFQMLYGIAEPLAYALVKQGFRVRLSVPYGRYWFPYLMRRLAERPANLGFFLKHALLG